MAESTTPRAGLWQWSAPTDTPNRAEFSESFRKIDDLMAIDMSGLRIDRPAPAIRGRYYTATDTGVIYRDTGTIWVAVGAGLEDAMARPSVAGNVGLVIRGRASQTGDLLQFQNDAGGLLGRVTAAGALLIAGSLLTQGTMNYATDLLMSNKGNTVGVVHVHESLAPVNNRTGYIEWRRPDHSRLAFMGHSATDLLVGLENGAAFAISGGGIDSASMRSFSLFMGDAGHTTSTTYTTTLTNSTASGTATGIKYPPSGRILIALGGYVEQSGGVNAHVFAALRITRTDVSPVQVRAPQDTEAVVIKGIGHGVQSSIIFEHFGVAGGTYDFTLMYRVAAGEGSYDNMRVVFIPVL